MHLEFLTCLPTIVENFKMRVEEKLELVHFHTESIAKVPVASYSLTNRIKIDSFSLTVFQVLKVEEMKKLGACEDVISSKFVNPRPFDAK